MNVLRSSIHELVHKAWAGKKLNMKEKNCDFMWQQVVDFEPTRENLSNVGNYILWPGPSHILANRVIDNK